MSPNPGELAQLTSLASKPQMLSGSQSWNRFKSVLAVVLAISLITNTGCTLMNANPAPVRLADQAFVGYRDYVWAQRAYNLQYGDCARPFRDHFRKGFIAGYCNICNGGDGFVPATPPQEYWSYEYQSSEGAGCVDSWFEGYPLGVSSAQQRGIDKYHDVYISKLMEAAIKQESEPVTLPSEIQIVSKTEADADVSIPPCRVEKFDRISELDELDGEIKSYEKMFQDRR